MSSFCLKIYPLWGIPRLSGKESACSAGDIGDVVSIPRSQFQEDPPEEEVYSVKCIEMYSLQYSCLGNPMDRSGLQSIGSQRVGHD